MLSIKNSFSKSEIKRSDKYKIRIVKCLKDTDLKDESLRGVKNTLSSLKCVIDSDVFLKKYLLSEGHPECKSLIKDLGKLTSLMESDVQYLSLLSKVVGYLKSSNCDLKDEYALKLVRISTINYEKNEAQLKKSKKENTKKILEMNLSPIGKINILKSDVKDFVRKSFEDNIKVSKINDRISKEQKSFIKLCNYKREILDKGVVFNFKAAVIALFGEPDNEEENVLEYRKYNLKFEFNSKGKLKENFKLPMRIKNYCLQRNIEKSIDQVRYFDTLYKCFVDGATVNSCDEIYCNIYKKDDEDYISICKGVLDRVFPNRMNFLGATMNKFKSLTSNYVSNCLVKNTFYRYCKDFNTNYSQGQIELRSSEVNQGYNLVNLKNEISKDMCLALYEDDKILSKIKKVVRKCRLDLYEMNAAKVFRMNKASP